MKFQFKIFFEETLCFLFGWIPTIIGRKIRRIVYRPFFKTASNFNIDSGVVIRGFSNISIGKNVSIAQRCYIMAHDGGRLKIGANASINVCSHINAASGVINIGNDTILGPEVLLRSANHTFSDNKIPIRKQASVSKPIIIGKDCWISARVIVVPGVKINDGAVIGAGAIVTKDIPQYTVAVGMPASPIKSRFEFRRCRDGSLKSQASEVV